MEGTLYSLIPPILMLVLVLVTRKVLLSLGAGIVIGALFIHNFTITGTLKEVWYVFYSNFVAADGSLNTDNILLLSFLLLLGIMTAFLQSSGGSRAFGEWMIKRVKTRKGAQLMTAFLGIMIFIDDYFNSLATGQIARPLTDRHRISRAKLAYYIDSTSAPGVVLSPISSWGAYIIGILGGIFAANQITDLKPLQAFIHMIPFNLYALSSIIIVFLVAATKMDIGPMRRHEERAIQKGQLLDPNQQKVPGELTDVFKPHQSGKVYHLIMPIIVLIVATIVAMVITGAKESTGDVTLLHIFANTNVNMSLFVGGVSAVLISLLFHLRQASPKANTIHIFLEGIKTMLPAIQILLLAWMVSSIIDTLQTGVFLAQLVTDANINPAFLPFIFFLLTCVMSLSTGTSWGTFGIMLPIAAEIVVLTDITMLIPALAAVLAGSVFGDHCSPISDTSILSSTGAGSNHMDHVLTQLPYAIMAATTAGIGYFMIGITDKAIFGLVTMLIVITAIVIINKLFNKPAYNH